MYVLGTVHRDMMVRVHLLLAYGTTRGRIVQRPIHPDVQASYEALVYHDNENIVYPVNVVVRDIIDDNVMDE